jgi:hypothetical protein
MVVPIFGPVVVGAAVAGGAEVAGPGVEVDVVGAAEVGVDFAVVVVVVGAVVATLAVVVVVVAVVVVVVVGAIVVVVVVVGGATTVMGWLKPLTGFRIVTRTVCEPGVVEAGIVMMALTVPGPAAPAPLVMMFVLLRQVDVVRHAPHTVSPLERVMVAEIVAPGSTLDDPKVTDAASAEIAGANSSASEASATNKRPNGRVTSNSSSVIGPG